MTEEWRKKLKKLLYKERERIDAQRKYYESMLAFREEAEKEMRTLLKYENVRRYIELNAMFQKSNVGLGIINKGDADSYFADAEKDAYLLKQIVIRKVESGEFPLDMPNQIYLYSGSYSRLGDPLESESSKKFHHNRYSYVMYPSSTVEVLKRSVKKFEGENIVVKRYPPLNADVISEEYFNLLIDYPVIEAQQILAQKYR